MNSHTEDIIKHIKQKGGEDTYLDDTRPHHRIYFTYRGIRRFVVTSHTSSDVRTFENLKSTVNNLLKDIEVMTPDYIDLEEKNKPRAIQEELYVPKTFGERLQFAREQQSLSRQKLAEAADVDEEQIRSFEINKEPEVPDLRTALKLTTALNLSLSYLAENLDIEGVEAMSDLGKRVQEKRKERGLTLGMLASETGIPVQQLANLETGLYPNFIRLPEIAKVLGTSVEELTEEGAVITEETINHAETVKGFSDIKTPEDFGRFIRFLRNKIGLTQRELAEKASPTPHGGQLYATDISKVEVGSRLNPVLNAPDRFAFLLEYDPTAFKAILAGVTDKLRVRTKTPSPQPQPPAPQPQFPSGTGWSASDADLLRAIKAEGEKTRALLAEQHKELVSAIRGISTGGGNAAAMLHTIIDNLFKN